MASKKQPQGQDELPKTPRLGPIDIRPETSDLLAELQDLVRKAGHHRPSQPLLLSALIHAAPKDGHALEMEYLVPFRKAFADSD